MVNKYTLGSIILGISLLAVLGANRAANWLSTSTDADRDERIVAVNTVSDTSQGNLGNTLDNRPTNNQLISQADQVQEGDLEDPALLPLEEAGTFIQRQKRVAEDRIVSDSQIEVIPISDGIAAAPQAATNSTTATTTTPTAAQPTQPAIPARW